MGEIASVVLVVVIGGVIAGVAAIKKVLLIGQPSEVIVISGPRRREGQAVGYRYIRGGRGIRIPLLEVVDRLDCTNIVVDVAVRNGYSRDGIPISIQGVANIKIDGDPPGLDNAVERLMGKTRDQIVKLARETLEGNLRGVMAKLTPEQVNEDKESFARELIEEAEVDLQRLGLTLDTLQIQTVSDEVGYLDSIGRVKNADIVRKARIAEAERRAEAIVRAAENGRDTKLSQIDAQIMNLRAEIEKRMVTARTERAALVARAEGQVASRIVAAEAQLKVQEARIDEVSLRLDADLVEPAKAYRIKKQAEARAAVAPIIETGRSTADGLRDLAITWRKSGEASRQVFLLEKMESLVSILVDTVHQVDVDRITVIDGAAAETTAGRAASVVEQLASATGIDVASLARRFVQGEDEGSSPATSPVVAALERDPPQLHDGPPPLPYD
jgi:flotillin